MRLQLPCEQLAHDRPLSRIDAYARWIPRPLGGNAIAIGRCSPGQQDTRPSFHLPPPSHPLRNQRPFIFCHSAAALQPQRIMGGVAPGAFETLYLAACALQLFQQDHLMDIIAGQTVGCGDEDVIDLGASASIAEAIEPWPI